MADVEQSQNLQRYTSDELSQYDGKEGRQALIAYKGKVYDVTKSRLWRNGVHVRAHSAGEDLSASMPAAPHDGDVMDEMPLVGVLYDPVDDGASAEPALHPVIAFSLEHHLHPIAVHFPTGLGAVSFVFFLASFVFAGVSQLAFEGLQHTAFWSLVVCLLGCIPSIITGWISWKYNYASTWTPIYRAKWYGSGVLVVLCLAAISFKLFAHGGLGVVELASPLTWVYALLLIGVAANVAVLGHYGGKITFPS